MRDKITPVVVDVDKVAVGKYIRELREKRGWSQDRLALEAGLPGKGPINQAERPGSKREPRASNLYKITKALGITIEQLLYPTAQESHVMVEDLAQQLLDNIPHTIFVYKDFPKKEIIDSPFHLRRDTYQNHPHLVGFRLPKDGNYIPEYKVGDVVFVDEDVELVAGSVVIACCKDKVVVGNLHTFDNNRWIAVGDEHYDCDDCLKMYSIFRILRRILG